jgi:glyoxylase-like metal-dependent hydrolase (beta-lactamase superfamily II)
MLSVESFTFNPFQENTYVLYDEESKQAAIIDPGCYDKQEEEELQQFIEKHGLTVDYLLNTHCHIDHVLGNAFVKRTFGVQLHAHPMEVPVLKAVESYAGNYGFQRYQPTEIDIFLREGDNFELGGHGLELLHLPGHAPGHLAFYNPKGKFILSGDVLFNGSIGRTDLPGGHHSTLIKSIKEKMMRLPDDTRVYAGHMDPTSIGKERKTNPFLR